MNLNLKTKMKKRRSRSSLEEEHSKPPRLASDMTQALDIASYKAYPNLAMFPRVRKVTLSADEPDRFIGVASSFDGLTLEEEDDQEPYDRASFEIEPEEIEMARLLLENKVNIRSLDLGIVRSSSAVPFLQHLGPSLVEFAYGINTWTVDRRPHKIQADVDRPNELKLVPLLSLAVDLEAHENPSYFAQSLIALSNLRSLTLGSRLSSKQRTYGPQIHPS